MPPTTRLSLLEQLQGDDAQEAWRRFSAIYEQWIENWLLRAGLSAADADDVRQEVLAAVFAEIPNFQHRGHAGAFRGWLRQIVVHRLRRAWERKDARQRRECSVDWTALADQLHDDASRLTLVWNEQHDRFLLGNMLNSLRDCFSEQSLTVFERVAIEGQSAQKVADDLGMSLGAVRVAQHRVLKALKQLARGIVE